mmetsp:Transcript_26217/g.52777  ORF Transcript_26217/g.52777 Transcript_26217/m.52777 type:complete len:526 (+) Transcript_26217:467-2044(+)
MHFELASDFVINDTLKPHVGDNFRVAAPGLPLHQCPDTGNAIYPKIMTTGSGNGIHEPAFFAKIVSMTGKDKPKVVYIGTPFFDREDKFESGTKSFRAIGCRIKRLMVAKECTTPSPEEMRRIIVDFPDVIVVSGGNSLFAMLRWQSIGLDLLIKEAALKGVVLCGGSAGCGCWFDTMQTDSLKPEACKLSERVLTELSAEERLNWSFVRISCMGYLNAFCVPHIDTKGTNEVARVDIAKKMLLDAQLESGMENPIIGFGVDELAGVVYEHGKVTIMSLGKRKNGIGEATCHILYVDQRREVMCIPLTPNTGEAATLEELIERAMRSVEALQSPLDLIVSEEISISHAVHRRGVSGAVDWGLIEATAPVKTTEADAPLVADQLPPLPPPPSHPHQRTPSNLLYSPAPLNIERIANDMNAITFEERCATPPPPPHTHQRTPSNLQYSPALHNIGRTSEDAHGINSCRNDHDKVPVGELPPPPAPSSVGLFHQGRMAAVVEQHNPNLPPLFPRGDLPAIKVCNSHSI